MSRFQQFENTYLYTNFGSVLSVEQDLVTEDSEEYYEYTLGFIRDTFGCKSVPTESQITKYISNNEDSINESNQLEFGVMIDFLFEKYMAIPKILKKLRTKRILRERLYKERENRLQEKNITKERKQLEKEQRKQQLHEFNNSEITCKCGIEYIRFSKVNHYKSVEHRYRMDGIRWIQSIAQDKYCELTCDTESAVSDDSSISSCSNK